jgi:hypothetical protein
LTDKDCGDCPEITESKIRVIISNSFFETTEYQWFWEFDIFRIITFGIIRELLGDYFKLYVNVMGILWVCYDIS